MTTTTANSPFPTSTPSSAMPATPSTDSKAAAPASGDALHRVVQGAHTAIDRMAETAAPAVQRLQDGVQAAGDTLSQRADDARALGEEWVDSLRGTVREHPLAALATALAVGVLVARLAR